jgi:hypothetical protein
MPRRIISSCLLALTLALACSALAEAQTPSATAVFRRLLLSDPDTAPSIKVLLRQQGGFVRGVSFADITGDQKSDAVVTVATGGAAGNVALYVFTADGLKGKKDTGTLRAVYRLQTLYRAGVAMNGTSILLTTPTYSAGNDLAKPGRSTQRTIRWNKAKGAFRVAATKRV